MSVTCDYASFDVPAYLAEYYADVSPENLALLRFLVEAFRTVPEDSVLLDFGGGPTLYAAIVAAGYVQEIHLADYSEPNLEQVRGWLRRDPLAFDWREFTRTVLELERKDASPAGILAREEAARQCITRVMHCDALLPCPIDDIVRPYDVVTTNFCAEAASRDRAQWQQCMGNIASLLKPAGKLIVSAVKGADSYAVGETSFFAVNLLEHDLVQMLGEIGFAPESILIDSVPADHAGRHYQGLMFASATRLPQA